MDWVLHRCQDTGKQIGILGQVHCSVGTDVLSGQSPPTLLNMVGMVKVESQSESIQNLQLNGLISKPMNRPGGATNASSVLLGIGSQTEEGT